MIEESDSECEEYSHDASDNKSYIPAANGGTGTPQDSDIEQEMIIELEKECDSDESGKVEPVPQNVSSIWIAKDKTEWSSNPLPSAQTRSRNILRQRDGPAANRNLFTRGGVEDTRLEANAKYTKKSEAKAKDSLSEDRPSRGQGQECSRPRPTTKDRAASVLQKKGLQRSFSGDLQFIGVPRIFDWGRPKPQITCYDVIKIFQKRNFLWDKDIVGWKI